MAFDNIKLEKGLYTTGRSFTQELEKLDPSENYKGTALEGLDAFERQLKRFDIKVSGRDSDTVSKFFSTTNSAVLFPEYLSRAVNQGLQGNDRIESIIATTTAIDSMDYRSIRITNTPGEYALSKVDEGATMTELNISVKGELTELKKYGKIITASYEAIKFQKLDVFSLTLKRLGEQISESQFNDAITNAASLAEEISISGTALAYEDLVKLWTALNPYTMTTLVANKTTIGKILNMTEFRDANAGLDFHATGRLITPFGAEIICFDDIGDEYIVGLDKNYAIEKVVASDVTTEFDKLIDRQIERATVSTIVGFSPIFSDAVKVLKLSQS